METLRVSAVGMEAAVEIACEGGASCFLSGLGISTKAMYEGAGVAGVAQLEKTRAHSMTTQSRLRGLFSKRARIIGLLYL